MIAQVSTWLKAYLVYAVYKNVQLDRSTETWELGVGETALHVLLFLFRLLPTMFAQRVLKLLPPNLVTAKWSAFDEARIRLIKFIFKVAGSEATNHVLALTTLDDKAKVAGKLCMEEIPRSRLGFDSAKSRAQFGDLGCSAMWLTLDSSIKFGDKGVCVLYYCHGGGFCFGNALMYLPASEVLLRKLKTEFGLNKVGILSIEYPLAPQVKHPLPMDLCFFALEYLLDTQTIRADLVIVSGDSAGGSIALDLAIRGKPLGIAAACLFSPWVGHALDQPSHVDFAQVDMIGGNALLERFQRTSVMGGPLACVQDARLHVLDKNLKFHELLPPAVWVCCGEYEVFHNDIVRFVNEAKGVGAQVELVVGEACPHDYALIWPSFPKQSDVALTSCARFCSAKFGQP
ncbi:hypothetical protein BASA81_003941 [Batrachochytrium salamandrivorans]|nr:hypothetical protein BASA81_003941 [Batrachochytrium salamandrivorans]